MISCSQNRLSESLQASYKLSGSQTDFPNFYMPPTPFAADKTDSPNAP